MIEPYSLLLLGHQTFKGTLSLDDSTDCWQQVTIALHNCLKELKHVDYWFRDNHPNNFGFYDGLPRVDAVLFWGMPHVWQRYDRSLLKRATGCRAIITICEEVITKNSHWRFAFRGAGAFTTLVDAPVWKKLYNQCAKCPKTVLIDHWSQDTPCDWTYQIEEWLENSAQEYCISRYVQHENDTTAPEREKKILTYLKQMHEVPFAQWLAQTDRLETFIMTHYESYGYAILDMFARGIRVLCPTPFLPPHFKEKFHFETFSTKNELIALLRTPPDALKLINNSAGLTDWGDVARLIDDRFQNLLRRRFQNLLSRGLQSLLSR
ncbi:MAG: hypothetical protein DME36_14265 [Verrucomicrobia bacterium]|nr:MAG: hypothetical protein DME36_14265 [Verrucomicrobiota bacterium]